MSLSPDSLLAWASDPEPTEGELVFDFVAGQIVLVIALEADAGGTTNVDAAAAAGTGTANDATTTSVTAPDPAETPRGGGSQPRPRPRVHCTGHLSIPISFSATSRVSFDVRADDDEVAAFL